ncbi:hypothetical protein [Glutamicibacter sp. NPDC127525]|uniref:hypothetical protein n=1 Tax=unclassified Glutamicibacter TaxID=2627139 RepID=UPI0036339799
MNTNQTPLNPDAIAQAKATGVDCRINGGSTEDVIECAVEAYLAAVQPVVNSFDPRGLNRKGWTCGCEPGNYDSCDECQSACNELANFLNRPEVKP